jgi:hypothetical protein
VSGRRITQQQMKIYQDSRQSGRLQRTAAAQAGMSERSGRRLEKGELQPQRGQPRQWRTRSDPLAEVWGELERQLTRSPGLQAITLLGYLEQQYPQQDWQRHYRTLQRRVKQWSQQRPLDSQPSAEVMFPQEYQPGEWGFSDFTELKGLEIRIQGEVFKHRFYHYRLAYSGWEHVEVIHGGESFVALAYGLQNALEACGGAPQIHRTDSLSAAFRNQGGETTADQTQRYEQLCAHYGLQPSRNNRGKGHENGRIESPHGHFKRQLQQALLLRGDSEFANEAEYRALVAEVVAKANARRRDRFEQERTCLRPLPDCRYPDYELLTRQVQRSSTIEVRCVVYSVPSVLIGRTVNLLLRHDSLTVCWQEQAVAVLPRRHAPTQGKRRCRQIDFRHVIDSLRRKPAALLQCQWRDELLPDDNYRHLWRQLLERYPPELAARLMVEALYIAATQDALIEVSAVLRQGLQQNSLTLQSLQQHFHCQLLSSLPLQSVVQHSLDSYDQFLSTLEPRGAGRQFALPAQTAQSLSHAQPLERPGKPSSPAVLELQPVPVSPL